MSPNGKEARNSSPQNGKEVENFMICSHPPTPRHPHDQDDDDYWTTVCCLCQEVMEPEDSFFITLGWPEGRAYMRALPFFGT
eukprot:4176581-Amphidinium_carterae.1